MTRMALDQALRRSGIAVKSCIAAYIGPSLPTRSRHPVIRIHLRQPDPGQPTTSK